jgi:hypothetical protein
MSHEARDSGMTNAVVVAATDRYEIIGPPFPDSRRKELRINLDRDHFGKQSRLNACPGKE